MKGKKYSLKLEQIVIFCMLIGHLIYERGYFKMSELETLTRIKHSTMQGVLQRLVSRKWIHKEHIYLLPLSSVSAEDIRNLARRRDPQYRGTTSHLFDTDYVDYKPRQLSPSEIRKRKKINASRSKKFIQAVRRGKRYALNLLPIYNLTYTSRTIKWLSTPEDFNAYRLQVFPFPKLHTRLLPLLFHSDNSFDKAYWYQAEIKPLTDLVDMN